MGFIFKVFIIGCVIFVLFNTVIGAVILHGLGVGIMFIGALITTIGNFLIWSIILFYILEYF